MLTILIWCGSGKRHSGPGAIAGMAVQALPYVPQ